MLQHCQQYAEQESLDDEEKASLEKIVVTGTRISCDKFSSASPIQVLNIEDAKSAGITNVAHMR